MASIINATTSTGLVQTADNSGSLQLQTNNGTTAVTIDTSQNVTIAGAQSVSGNLSFNSGYGSSAVAYGCRAWVNFDGISGTTIRGSGNISSVTRVSAGRYDINFTTAMPDANYSPVAFLNGTSGTGAGAFVATGLWGVNSLATGSLRVEYYTGGFVDSSLVFVAVFR